MKARAEPIHSCLIVIYERVNRISLKYNNTATNDSNANKKIIIIMLYICHYMFSFK